MKKTNPNEITNIEIGKLSYDAPEKNSRRRNSQVVADSVKIHGYDEQAPPLSVYPDPRANGYFIVIDGKKRLRGARQNEKITSLPCQIIDAKNIQAARRAVANTNAPVLEVRDRKTLGYHCIEMLSKPVRRRKNSSDRKRQISKNSALTKNLALTDEQLTHLCDLADVSLTTCNRALAVIRSLYKEIKPKLKNGNLQQIFLKAKNSGQYPEFSAFYDDGISVTRFQREYAKRIINSRSRSAPNQAEKSSRPATAGARAVPGADQHRCAEALIDQIHIIKDTVNISLKKTGKQRNAQAEDETSDLLKLIGRLSEMPFANGLGKSAGVEAVRKFLTRYPAHRRWLGLLAKCAREYPAVFENEPHAANDFSRLQPTAAGDDEATVLPTSPVVKEDGSRPVAGSIEQQPLLTNYQISLETVF